MLYVCDGMQYRFRTRCMWSYKHKALFPIQCQFQNLKDMVYNFFVVHIRKNA